MHELLHPRMCIQHNNSLVTPIDFVIVSRSKITPRFGRRWHLSQWKRWWEDTTSTKTSGLLLLAKNSHANERLATRSILLLWQWREVIQISLSVMSWEGSHLFASEEWVRFGKGLILTLADKEHILTGGILDDRHIDVAQNLLKQQFPEVGGLQSILLQAKPRKRCEENKQMIQIVHSCGDHWIIAAIYGAFNRW